MRGSSTFGRLEGARLFRMALAKGATMGRTVEPQSDERSLNLDAIRASLEEAAAVLAEMTDRDASVTPLPSGHE
jgi:hypothetical protein